MKLKLAFLNLFLGCISLLLINTKFTSNVVRGEELQKVELNNEIKKGKFLIGLKQYLGGENDSFSKKKNINFITDKGFLNLISSNGIKHKSKRLILVGWIYPSKIQKQSKELFLVLLLAMNQQKNNQRNLKIKDLRRLLPTLKIGKYGFHLKMIFQILN